MPRYSLRTLIAIMLLGGPVLAGIWRFRHVHFVESFILLFFVVVVFYTSCAMLLLAIRGVECLVAMFLTAGRSTEGIA